MVIVDECHHVSAVSFENILKNINAKYVYGLTATPARRDGHHPIIFMHCGAIRYRDDAKKQAEKRPFEHFVIPRFTSFRVPIGREETDMNIADIYTELSVSELRNQNIVSDIINCYESGRNCLVLTERTAHAELLAKMLRNKIPNAIVLTGGRGTKQTREALAKVADTPETDQLLLIATGKYIGEGFDEPRLDTLFLAMPIAWKGTLQQYAGRLHRLHDSKKEVLIYDYVDVNIRVLEKMYGKRLSGYGSIGYKARGESFTENENDIIFDKSNFWPVYTNDLVGATNEIIIVSPFVTKRTVSNILQYFSAAVVNEVRVTIVTRHPEAFSGKGYAALEQTLKVLKSVGVNIVFKTTSIHQKFAVIDQRLVWYGSINLLGFGSAEESMMRLESTSIAGALLASISKSTSATPIN